MVNDRYIDRTEKHLGHAKEILSYDPDTGIFHWKVARTSVPAGAIAGAPTKTGHLRIMVCGKMYFAHHLAWWWLYGYLPKPRTVDHENGNGSDNRKTNLRRCTPSLNAVNRDTHNKTGYRGVRARTGYARWSATIRVNNKGINLGSYRSPEAAARAYDAAALQHFGEFARLNFPTEQP